MLTRSRSIFAIVALLLLRTAIGWQMFYEGVWKVKTLSTNRPWTAAGYLENAQGPLRTTFQAIVGDPHDLEWLDVKRVSKKWKRWQKRFATHYDLDPRDRARLSALVSGSKAFYSDADQLPELPTGVLLDKLPISFDAEHGRLVVDGKKHLSPKEYAKLLAQVQQADDPLAETYRQQLEKVYKRASRLSYVEQLQAMLHGDPDIAGIKTRDGEVQQIGALQEYRNMVADYEASRAAARLDFEQEHLQALQAEVKAQHDLVVGPVLALDQSLKNDALELLDVEQLQRGELPRRWKMLRIADSLTIVGLVALGLCLMIGFGTRIAALLAATLLFLFYLAMPPLPGLPVQPGPEHSLFVNKNLIEVLALVSIAALPSGYWFGLDSVVGKLIHHWRRRRSTLHDED